LWLAFFALGRKWESDPQLYKDSFFDKLYKVTTVAPAFDVNAEKGLPLREREAVNLIGGSMPGGLPSPRFLSVKKYPPGVWYK